MPIVDYPEAQAILRTAPLSGPLHDLASRGELRRYAKGALLIEEGDSGDTLYLIISGRVKAFSASSSREVIFGQYGCGEYVGEMSLDGGLRAASVMTLEKTVCALVTRPTLEAFIAEQPAFAFDLLSKVIRRARAATLSAKQMALNDVYGRLKLLLESLAVQVIDGGLMIEERLTHQEIAGRLGCSREMVSKLMKDLSKGGYIINANKDGMLLPNALPPRW